MLLNKKIKSLGGWPVARFSSQEFDLLKYIFQPNWEVKIKIQRSPSSQEWVLFLENILDTNESEFSWKQNIQSLSSMSSQRETAG